MHSKIGLITLLTALGLARAQAPEWRPPLRPSNGVLEMNARPVPEHDPRPLGQRREAYRPWSGLTEITIRNSSKETVRLVEIAAVLEFGFDVVDSEGRPADKTDLGRRVIEPRSPQGRPLGAVERIQIAPQQENTIRVDLSNYFKIEPGRAYRVTIRRSRGIPDTDDAGKPIKEVEISCSFEVPSIGLPRDVDPH